MGEDPGKLVLKNVEKPFIGEMGKILRIKNGFQMSMASTGFGALIKDLMRNDEVEGQFLFISKNPAISLNFETDHALSVIDDHKIADPGIWVFKNVGTSMNTDSTYVKPLLVGRAGSGWTIKRTSTDTELAPAAFGLESRTTFPTLQTFAEKALTIIALRVKIGGIFPILSPLWEPPGAPSTTPLVGIVVDQTNQRCSVVFEGVSPEGTWRPMIQIALDEGDTSHFAE